MNKNDLNISNLEKYTFSKHSREIYGSDKFSFDSKNSLFNHLPSYQASDILKEKYSDKMINNNNDINYNQINITHYDHSFLKKKYNNINNINIISQKELYHNTNYNKLNKMNINRSKKTSFSKERKFDRKKFRTPNKYFNYNKFNYFDSNNSEKKIQLNNSNFNNKNINYNNENVLYKYNKRQNKRALTPDNTYLRNNRKYTSNNDVNKNMIINPIDYNRNININNINIINHNSEEFNLKSKNCEKSFKDSSYNQLNFNDTYSNNENNFNMKDVALYNFSSSMKNKTNQKYGIRNIQKITDKILDSNNSNPINIKRNSYLNYQDSCFNTRLPRGAKIPFIEKLNKNLTQSAIYNNKTPSPVKKNNNYFGSAIYNTKTKKYLKYKRSVSSESDIKKINNKLKQKYFKLKIFNKDYSPDNSFSRKSHDNSHVNSCINKKYNKIFKNINTSCGNYNSSLYNNDKSCNYSNEKNYNMTQPDFSKSLYNWNKDNSNNINKLFNKEDENHIKNLVNNKNNKDLYFKYLKNDSQNYNYQSYIESYNSNNRDNSSIKSNKSLKTKKYNFEKYLNLNSNTTKLSTNNNTYDENSNNTNSLCNKETKNNKNIGSSTIEEVHLNFVNILQNTKNMMEFQENGIKDKIIYNNVNSTTIILEERELD